MRDTKVVIIGAGPAGTVCAAWLLQNGIQPVIIEKSKFPRIVVGESLLPKSMEHFEATGLLDPLKKANFQVKPGARFIKKDKIFYLNFSEQFTPGWSWTWQVPREHFDNVLAQEVMSRGGEIFFGASISNIDFSKKEPVITFEHEGSTQTIKTEFIIDSSGFGSVIPRILKQEVKKQQLPKYAVFTHVLDTNKEGVDQPQMISFDVLDLDLWFWVIPFSNGVTSLGFVGDKRHFEENPGDQKAYFREMMKRSAYTYDRFKNAEMLIEPIWHKGYAQSVDQLFGENYVLTGNCVEFLDPVFSSGVAFATESGLLSAKLLVRKFKGEAIDWQKEYVDHMHKGINVFRSYVDGWYEGDLQDVFFTDNVNQDFKDQICSVLAGYVWDDRNPFVRKHATALKSLAKVVRMKEGV